MRALVCTLTKPVQLEITGPDYSVRVPLVSGVRQGAKGNDDRRVERLCGTRREWTNVSARTREACADSAIPYQRV